MVHRDSSYSTWYMFRCCPSQKSTKKRHIKWNLCPPHQSTFLESAKGTASELPGIVLCPVSFPRRKGFNTWPWWPGSAWQTNCHVQQISWWFWPLKFHSMKQRCNHPAVLDFAHQAYDWSILVDQERHFMYFIRMGNYPCTIGLQSIAWFWNDWDRNWCAMWK